MKANGIASQPKQGGGLRLFVVLVALLSVALGTTVILSEENVTVADETEYLTYGFDEQGNAVITGLTEEGKAFTGTLEIPDKIDIIPVVAIAEDAFNKDGKDYKFTGVTIGNNVVSIESEAFANNDQMTSVSIGTGLKSVDSDAFFNCSGVTSLTFNAIKMENFNYDTTPFGDFGSESSFETTFGQDVTSIPSCIFAYNDKLTKITIGENVKTIGYCAFLKTAIKEVVIPANMETISSMAFYECGQLTTITWNAISLNDLGHNDDIFRGAGTDNNFEVVFGSEVTKIPAFLFHDSMGGKPKVSSVTIGEKVETIGEYAFKSCEKIKTVTIPNNVTSVGNNAFNGCTGITTLTLGSGLKTIGESAFEGCSTLTGSIDIPNSVTEIKKNAFKGTAITGLKMGDKIQLIGEHAFYECKNLAHIEFGTFSDKVEIGSFVFGHDVASNDQTNYKFKNLVLTEQIEFTQQNVRSGLFSDRIYDKSSDVFTMPSANIKFDPNGGSGTVITLTTDSTGKIQTGEFPADPTREGYFFLGWYDGDNKVTSETLYDKNTTVLAKWNQEHTITFDPNGGTCDVQTMKTDAEGKLSSIPTATREGYTFDGWYDGSTKITTDTVFTKDTTVTAKWKAIITTHTVTFDANGGTCDVQTMDTNDEGKLSSLPTPTREGYTFDGWYLDGKKVTQDTVFTSDATVTAQWTAVPEPEPEKKTGNDLNIALLIVLVLAVLGTLYVALRRN